MRLLKKDEIRKELNVERKAQIDEGVAIAKKVDTMRELLQTEQKNLDTFRDKTVETVQRELGEILRKKDEATLELEIITEKITTMKEKLSKFKKLLDNK